MSICDTFFVFAMKITHTHTPLNYPYQYVALTQNSVESIQCNDFQGQQDSECQSLVGGCVYLPLWKMMEFGKVGMTWHSQLNGEILISCSKPQTSSFLVSHWSSPYGFFLYPHDTTNRGPKWSSIKAFCFSWHAGLKQCSRIAIHRKYYEESAAKSLGPSFD